MFGLDTPINLRLKEVHGSNYMLLYGLHRESSLGARAYKLAVLNMLVRALPLFM